MTEAFTITLDTAELDRIQRELGWRTDTVIRRMAFELQGIAQVKAPHDTNALRNSIYTNTSKGSKYSEADAGAKARNPAAQTSPIPEASGEMTAVVGACVNYAQYLEEGTSRMAAQPFLKPAAEMVQTKLADGSTYKELISKAPPKEAG